VVTSPLSRRERKKLDTRDRIVSAALDAFSRRGIDGATIDEIALAADVGKGTVYNYFRTKEEIVVAFLLDIERDTQRKVSKLTTRRGSLESTLATFILHQFKLKEPHYAFVRVFLAELCGRATGDTEWLADSQTVIDPPLIELFTALQKRKVVRADVDMPTLIGAFKVMHLGLTVVWAIEGPPWSGMDETVREQVRLFCSGIEARS
jgi:AcrR family transcriptional regulator